MQHNYNISKKTAWYWLDLNWRKIELNVGYLRESANSKRQATVFPKVDLRFSLLLEMKL